MSKQAKNKSSSPVFVEFCEKPGILTSKILLISGSMGLYALLQMSGMI